MLPLACADCTVPFRCSNSSIAGEHALQSQPEQCLPAWYIVSTYKLPVVSVAVHGGNRHLSPLTIACQASQGNYHAQGLGVIIETETHGADTVYDHTVES